MNNTKVLDREKLREDLIRIQGTKSDRIFAAMLGISRMSWWRIKRGKVNISDKFLVRANDAFPHLNIFLPKSATIYNAIATDAPETSQNRKISGLSRWLREIVRRVMK